jgi:hypothetical protein
MAAVSSLGRFKSTRGVITTPQPKTNGYVEVGVNGKRYMLHRLIATAFGLPKDDSQTQVNHKDGNPSNNCVDNLEWVSQSQNVSHSYRTNTTRLSSAIRKSKPVRGRRVGTVDWTEFSSAHDAARSLGVDRGNIQKCLRGAYRQINGYEFEAGTPHEALVLDGEEWRDTHDGAGVSSLGRVRTRDGLVYTPHPRRDGYVVVCITDTTYLVHRLVAEAFQLPRTPDAVEVNHKDGDPSNNTVTNLEWTTKRANIQHSYDTNASRKSNAARRSKPVRGRRVGSEEWTTYASAHEAADALGLNHGNVTRVCTGLRPSAGGYTFEYVPQTEVLEGEEWRSVEIAG